MAYKLFLTYFFLYATKAKKLGPSKQAAKEDALIVLSLLKRVQGDDDVDRM
jgi:hypothetical protein